MPSIDAALRDWPEAGKSDADWDERAESVMGRLRRGERGASAAYVSNDDLLSDPLGHSEEDGHNADAPGAPVIHSPVTPRAREAKMQTIDRDRDRKSLQDLAQMAKGMTPPPSSVAAFGPVPSTRSVTNLPNEANKKADDSGIVDLAAASAADPQAAVRAQTTPLANQSLFDDVPPPPPVNAPPASYIPPPPPVNAPPSGHHAVHAYQQPAPSVPPPSVGSVPPPPAAYASVHPIAPSLQQKKSGAGALVFAFAGVLAIGAAAAGGFLYIRSHKPAPAPVAATTVAAPVTPAVVAENTPKPAEPAPVVAENKPSDGATDLSSLPNASAPAKSGTKVAMRTPSAKPAAKADTTAADKAAAEDDAKAKADKAKLDQALAGNSTPAAPAAPAGAPGDLGAAMNQASGGGKMQEQKPAAGASGSAGNVPQKPSQGAVTGALGAVLPAARDCLGPDDPISKASVVFNSDGSVASVSVSGSAAGKPAATCIEKELRRAKVQPFAEPTYTANITIRHN
jgi:hypothetical protein